MTDGKIQIRCDAELRRRWKVCLATYDPDALAREYLSVLLTIAEEAPDMVALAEQGALEREARTTMCLYPRGELAEKWRFFSRHHDSEEEALSELLSLAEEHSDELASF